MVVYNIIAHKLALAIYHLLKERSEYRAELLMAFEALAANLRTTTC